jgi:hypothetical protein
MHAQYFRARLCAALLIGGTWLALSCSSDPTSTLGSDNKLLGSEPGTVYQDTIGVLDDTTYAFKTPIATDTDLEVGNDGLYTHIIVLQPGFILKAGDVDRTVQTAAFHFSTVNVSGNFPVRFYALEHSYTEGDTIGGLNALADSMAILDPVAGSIERNLETATPLYPIPAALAQEWIRDPTKRKAIAVVYTDTVDKRVTTIPSKDATEGHPYLQVNYTDGIQRSYDIRDDATAYLPDVATSNLVVSDGYPRRVYFRGELDSLAKDSAVHLATVRLHIVPNTLLGKATSLILYIPDSTDPKTAAFKTGQRIDEVAIDSTSTVLSFPMRNAIFLILQKKLKNTGFAIRFANENTELRQVELYGTGEPDSLRPKIFVTSSTPAVFH